MSKKEIVIKPEKFIVKKNQNTTLIRQQIPLTLAWALSIHKSQVIYIMFKIKNRD